MLVHRLQCWPNYVPQLFMNVSTFMNVAALISSQVLFTQSWIIFFLFCHSIKYINTLSVLGIYRHTMSNHRIDKPDEKNFALVTYYLTAGVYRVYALYE